MQQQQVWYVGDTPIHLPSLEADGEWAPGGHKFLTPEQAEGLDVDGTGSLFVSHNPVPSVAAENPPAEVPPVETSPVDVEPAPSGEGTE